MVLTNSSAPTSPTSGTPEHADTAAPDTYTAWKPACLAASALRPLNTPGTCKSDDDDDDDDEEEEEEDDFVIISDLRSLPVAARALILREWV